MTISRLILVRMRNIHIIAVEKSKTHILCSVHFPKNRMAYEMMWKYMAEADRPQMTI